MLKNYLAKLISFKTLSLDHRENLKALLWYKKELRGLPLNFKQFSFNGFPALYISTKKTKKPKILLQSHIDVVDGRPSLFKAKIAGGKIFGRGVFDMKYAAASYLALLKDLGSELSKLNLGVFLSTDEEVGGKNGVGEFLNQGYACDFFVLPDSGSNWDLQKSAKGTLRFTATARGKSGHGSRPWQGVNAVEKLMEFLASLKLFFKKEPCGDGSHFHPTLNIGSIMGGQEANKIPDSAQAKLDVRIVPDAKRTVEKQMFALAKKFPEITLELISKGDYYSVPIKNPVFQTYVKILKAELGFTPRFVNSHGSTDAKYFIAKKLPGIVFRPLGGGHHSGKEWIEIKSLEEFYRTLKLFVVSQARV